MYGIPLILSVLLGSFLIYRAFSWLSTDSIAWIVGVPTTVFFLIVTALLNGWVISCLWDWFMVPMGAPHMPVTSALGLASICQLLIHQEGQDHSKKSAEYDSIAGFLTAVFVEIFASRMFILLMGWVITLFQ